MVSPIFRKCIPVLVQGSRCRRKAIDWSYGNSSRFKQLSQSGLETKFW